MQEYLDNPDIKNEQELPSRNSQFHERSGESLKRNARIFKEFESEDEKNFPVKTKFMIIEKDTDSKPGGYIYLYRDGKLLDRNFIPSSEPRKLTITDIKHDSVKLTWE